MMQKTLSVLAATGFFFGMSRMAAVAGTATANLTVSVTLENSCTVSEAAMDFTNTAALLSSGDQIADTGTTLKVACTTGSSPTIWSSSPRFLVSGPNSIPFNLSQESGAALDDLPTAAPGEAISGYIADGTEKVVPLFSKILALNFGDEPASMYTANITVSVNY
jgi:spore coat protein U-like protein